MEAKLIAWLSIGISVGVFALIIWIFRRKLFKKPALAPEVKSETEEKKEKETTPKKTLASRVSKFEGFWWKHFKPLVAIPIAWGSLHLAFVLMSPDLFKEIWVHYRGYLITAELAVFVLCVFLNKKTPFEERTSRKLLVGQYIYIFIIAGIIIIFRIGWSETAANLDRMMLSKLVNSRVELVAEDVERLTKAYRARPALEKLDELRKKAKKLDQLDEKEKDKFFSEFKKMKSWKTEAQKEYAVPDEKKIDWQELWPFGKSAEAQKPPRRLSGILKLPADEKIVDKDTQGRPLYHGKGECLHFIQLTDPPGNFWVINHHIPSFQIKRRNYITGRAVADGIVELKSAGGKEIMVQVRIIPRS